MIKSLLDPFTVFWLGILLSGIFFYVKRRRWGRGLLALSLVWLLVCSFPFLPNHLIRSLEDSYQVYQPAANDSTAYHILVLGGGHTLDERLPPNAKLNINALGRLVEGIRLHRLLPGSKLMLSGHSSSGGTTQAEVLAQTSLLLGVEESDILLQKEPSNTYEEAKAYVGKFGKQHPLIVVTSANHMPRAMKMFNMLGREAIAAPTDFRVKIGPQSEGWGPSVYNIVKMRVAISEYVALWAADWRY